MTATISMLISSATSSDACDSTAPFRLMLWIRSWASCSMRSRRAMSDETGDGGTPTRIVASHGPVCQVPDAGGWNSSGGSYLERITNVTIVSTTTSSATIATGNHGIARVWPRGCRLRRADRRRWGAPDERGRFRVGCE